MTVPAVKRQTGNGSELSIRVSKAETLNYEPTDKYVLNPHQNEPSGEKNAPNASSTLKQMGYSHYVVWAGRKPGIYTNWAECRAQTDGFPNAKFKGYHSHDEALKAVALSNLYPPVSQTIARSEDVHLDKGSTSSENDQVKATIEGRDLKVTLEGTPENMELEPVMCACEAGQMKRLISRPDRSSGQAYYCCPMAKVSENCNFRKEVDQAETSCFLPASEVAVFEGSCSPGSAKANGSSISSKGQGSAGSGTGEASSCKKCKVLASKVRVLEAKLHANVSAAAVDEALEALDESLRELTLNT